MNTLEIIVLAVWFLCLIAVAGFICYDYMKQKPPDLIEVVRCKNCKKWHTQECALDYAMFDPTCDGYCSYGERKSNEQETKETT